MKRESMSFNCEQAAWIEHEKKIWRNIATFYFLIGFLIGILI